MTAGRTLRAQVADFLDLQEIEKGVGLGDGDEASFFPARQLAGREAKNPYQIDSIVAVHRNDETTTPLSRT